MKEKLWGKILEFKPVVFVFKTAKRIILPGFQGLAFYDVALFFFKGLQKGSLTTRASSLSFTFFLALFPAILFFFTLIPYIPMENYKETLLQLINEFLPKETYKAVTVTIEDIIVRKRGGLLSFGFILAIYLSTNGVNAIINAFNKTYHSIETRSFFRKRVVSVFLVFVLSFLIIIAVGLISGGTLTLNFLLKKNVLESHMVYYLISYGRWFVILLMVYFSVSFLYYFAPADKKQFKFFSAGSSLATFLSVIATLGFNFYISNFSHYNALYGSIGTLIIILLWIYFNSLILLIGFELNASISQAKTVNVSGC